MTQLQTLSGTVNGVQKMVEEKINSGALVLPQNYSYGNALKQAQLLIQGDQKLMSCSQESIAKALLDYAIMGLNVSKDQAYFIPYNNSLKLSVSYQGKKAMAKRIDEGIEDITARTVRAGEIFEFDDLDNGYSVVTKHKRTIETMNSSEIVGGYATVTYNDGRASKSLIMTFDRIKKSWSMSKNSPLTEKGEVKATSVHGKFTDEMIGRTVIAAMANNIIRPSNDHNLFIEILQSLEIEEKRMMAEQEVQEKANTGEMIDIDEVPNATEGKEVANEIPDNIETVEEPVMMEEV